MKRWRILLFLNAISLLLCCSAASALPIMLYDLLPGTTFKEGCVGPCMCPAMSSGIVKGAFGLVSQTNALPTGKTKASPAFNIYKLRDIAWTVYDSTGQAIHSIEGEGTYQFRRVGAGIVKQQLTLKVSIDGENPILLDSGQVVGYGRFPAFCISIRRGAPCFDTEMDIVAAPVRPTPVAGTVN